MKKKCYPNRKYLFKTANNQTTCELIKIKNSINVNDYQKIPAGVLEMNDIAECEILLDKEFAMLPYEENKTLGNFLLIDKSTNLTVAAGTIKHNLRRSTNITWQENDIDRSSRQKPFRTAFVCFMVHGAEWFREINNSQSNRENYLLKVN